MTVAIIIEWSIKIAIWWTCIGVLSLPFVLALLKANGPDREPSRIRIIAVDGRRVGER